MIEVDHIADHSNFVSAQQVAEVIQRQYVIGVHLASVGASIAGTLILLVLILLIAATVHSCCYGGECCGCFWWSIFKCICGKCDHEEAAEEGGKGGSNAHADPIPIAGVQGVPPNTPDSTYTGASSRRQSMSRFGAISRSPSMPSLREAVSYTHLTLPTKA